ncbi:MAG TPA: hypothetical protein PK958_06660 [Rhodocyclaceae bacterium]|nr:hypothetical protein [Rhodocyclaceae bacterium]HNH98619.1 hypothetical protein [Rhodocyclaceae bacterium]
MRQISKGGDQIAQPDLGQEVLPDRLGQFAGEVLDGQTALELFETLLDASATVVERGELTGRESRCVEEGGDQELALPGRRKDANQTDGKAVHFGLDALSGCLAGGCCRDDDVNDRLCQGWRPVWRRSGCGGV